MEKTKEVNIELEEDAVIETQKFVCLSFVSPDKILKQKDIFFFEHFVKHWEINKSLHKFKEFLQFQCVKYNIDFNKSMKDLEEFIEAEKQTIAQSDIEEDFGIFMEKYEEELQLKFDELNKFQTSVRGLKIRGSFATKEEADAFSIELRNTDPNHSIYVGDVGKWLPWDPSPTKTGEVNYMDGELNKLMHEKTKNEAKAKSMFNDRVKEAKQKAIATNEQNAKKTGVKLTQDIDSEGNLIGRQNASTVESFFSSEEEVSIDRIKSVLFEGDNIVIPHSEEEKEGKKLPQSFLDKLQAESII
jgi:DNA-binding XRE family transcriptional regulator